MKSTASVKNGDEHAKKTLSGEQDLSLPIPEKYGDDASKPTIVGGGKDFNFDSTEFYEVFTALYPRLINYARRYGATFPEDIAQEAFVILMQRENPVIHPVAFLYGTVRTLSLTERRPMKNQNLSLDAILIDPGMMSDADDRLLSREIRERMRTLSPTFREALWLFVVEGLSIKEIAEIIDIPEATVKTRIFRAKAQLREQLNPNGGIHVMA